MCCKRAQSKTIQWLGLLENTTVGSSADRQRTVLFVLINKRERMHQVCAKTLLKAFTQTWVWYVGVLQITQFVHRYVQVKGLRAHLHTKEMEVKGLCKLRGPHIVWLPATLELSKVPAHVKSSLRSLPAVLNGQGSICVCYCPCSHLSHSRSSAWQYVCNSPEMCPPPLPLGSRGVPEHSTRKRFLQSGITTVFLIRGFNFSSVLYGRRKLPDQK